MEAEKSYNLWSAICKLENHETSDGIQCESEGLRIARGEWEGEIFKSWSESKSPKIRGSDIWEQKMDISAQAEEKLTFLCFFVLFCFIQVSWIFFIQFYANDYLSWRHYHMIHSKNLGIP